MIAALPSNSRPWKRALPALVVTPMKVCWPFSTVPTEPGTWTSV
jgi:hypothetical protein